MIEGVRSAAASLPRQVASLYDRSLDRVLARPYEIATAEDARELLASGSGDGDGVSADQIQRIALIVTPLIRRAGLAKKVPGVRRFPVVLSIVTVANVGRAVSRGVRDVQVVGSYVASRVRATGREPDPGAVKRLTVQLYLSPMRRPDPSVPVAPLLLLRRWLVNGLLGRSSSRAAERAIKAVERLDVSNVATSLDVGTVAERTIAPALKAGG